MSDIFTTHFWLFCGLWVGGLGALQIAFDASKREATIRTSARRFAVGWFTSLMSMCVAYWLLQLSAGQSTPQFNEWPSPHKWLALLVQVFVVALFAWWIWLKGG